MQQRLECFGRWEEQLWPDCGGHLILFSHPTPSEAAKPPKPFLLGFRPKLMTIAYFENLSVTDGHFQPRVLEPIWGQAGRGQGRPGRPDGQEGQEGQGPGRGVGEQGPRTVRAVGGAKKHHPAWTSLKPSGPDTLR